LTTGSFSAAARQVIFQKPTGNAAIRLYTSNPLSLAQEYDFARVLPSTVEPAPVSVKLAKMLRNPRYTPPAVPWTERLPWLLYVVLFIACAVLLGLIFSVSRFVIHQHDALAEETQVW